jgi:hypothetical protein
MALRKPISNHGTCNLKMRFSPVIRTKLLVTMMAVAACVALGQSGPVIEVASVKRVTSGANPGDIPRNMDNNPLVQN